MTKIAPQQQRAILEALEAGGTRQGTADQLGISKSAVNRVAKAAGLTRRTNGPDRTDKPDRVVQELPPALAPVLPDPDLVDEHFQSVEVLQETVAQLEAFADFGKSLQQMAQGLSKTIIHDCYDRMPDGSLKIKIGLGMSKARQAAGLLEQVAKAGAKGINIYRTSRGLYDKQELKHSGRIEGTRGEDSFASYLGFPLQGTGGRDAPLSGGVPGGQEQAQDLGSEQEDREELSRSN